MSENNLFYTVKNNALYVICTKWPEKPVVVDNIKKSGKITMLGTDKPVKYSLKKNKLEIVPPAFVSANCNYAWVFKVEDFE